MKTTERLTQNPPSLTKLKYAFSEDGSSVSFRWCVSEDVKQAVPCLSFHVDITIITKIHLQCVGQGEIKVLVSSPFSIPLQEKSLLVVKIVSCTNLNKYSYMDSL